MLNRLVSRSSGPSCRSRSVSIASVTLTRPVLVTVRVLAGERDAVRVAGDGLVFVVGDEVGGGRAGALQRFPVRGVLASEVVHDLHRRPALLRVPDVVRELQVTDLAAILVPPWRRSQVHGLDNIAKTNCYQLNQHQACI